MMRRIVINIHGLGIPPKKVLEEEEKYWIAPDFLEEIVKLSKFYSTKIDIEFTFDDGYFSDIEIGAPILLKSGYRAKHFLLTGKVGKKYFLNENDIQELIKMGNIIGSHGVSHLDWTTLGEAELYSEIVESKKVLSQIIDKTVEDVGIPFGSYNLKVLSVLRKEQFKKIYTSDKGTYRVKEWLVPRTSLTKDMSTHEFERLLLGKENILKKIGRTISKHYKAIR